MDVTVKATVFFEKKFWVATFERTDKEGYRVARHIFGGEPTDPEIYDFVLSNYHTLNFGKAKEIKVEIHRKNPKRLQREVKREMEKIKQTTRPSSFAQDYMREELEKNKKEKKLRRSEVKKELQKERFNFKQDKKKKKQRGH